MPPSPTVPLCPLHMVRLNVMVSGGGTCRKRLGHECRALVNGISALLDTPESSHISSSVTTQQEDSQLQVRNVSH